MRISNIRSIVSWLNYRTTNVYFRRNHNCGGDHHGVCNNKTSNHHRMRNHWTTNHYSHNWLWPNSSKTKSSANSIITKSSYSTIAKSSTESSTRSTTTKSSSKSSSKPTIKPSSNSSSKFGFRGYFNPLVFIMSICYIGNIRRIVYLLEPLHE